MIKPIYLDYNGTTPHDPEVIEAMRPFLETEFPNFQLICINRNVFYLHSALEF